MSKKKLIEILRLKVKFAFSSVVATIADYSIYLFLVNLYLSPVPSNLISASVGMVINFLFQKRFIFDLKRKVDHTFLLSAATSLGGVGLSTLMIHLLNYIPFFFEYQFITKALVIGIVFNYNFYMKRFAFEKRFLP